MDAKPYKINYYNNVECKNVDWLWYPYIPYGKITIIQGDPGDGKSTFALNLAAIVSNGETLPFINKKTALSAVVYQNNEDGKEDTICPRLKACGANLDNIAYIDETDASLSMGDERLEKVLDETNAKVLILDPIQAYFGNGTDMNRAGDIRPIMNKLSQMAARRNCAVILIGHMSKGKSANGLYRGLGSIDIAAAARSVLMIARMPDESNVRILAHIKNNLAPLGDSIIFRINMNSTITWMNRSKLTIKDIMENEFKDADDKLDRAKFIIQDLLKNGKCSAKMILTECMNNGILNCVPSAARLLAIPNGKHQVGVVYHIIVPHEHTGAEVVVIDHRDLVRFFKYLFIASGFGGRPFQGLIRAGDSAFQLDVKVVMLPKLNDSFGKVHIDAESHSGNKMVIAIFKIISNSASKGLDILIVIGSFFFITPRQLCGPMPGNAHCFHLFAPHVKNYIKILGKNQAILGFRPVFSKIKSLYYY